ncbi:MAG: hypothetical protein C4518_02710 [Desulfobacteraceae bacterium]|nr:MAG: hypothetical protein C4518_02710 [Desulfobacteraceae bacterium]
MRKKNPKKTNVVSKAPVPSACSLRPKSSDDLLDHINGFYLFFTLVVIVQLFVFKDYIVLDKLLIYLDAGCDSYNQFYPEFVHSARYIRTEGLPTWSFCEGMGQSIFPGGISSPFFWLFNLFGMDRLAYGIVFIELLKSTITGVLFYFFFKTLKFSKYSCVAGGLLASCLGYLIVGSSGWYGHSTNVVYFILLLYAFELFYQKNNWLLFPVAVFFTAGNPFRLYLYSVFLFTYALLRMLSEPESNVKNSIAFLFKLAGAGAIGVGMNAVFSYNNLLEMINSPRVSGDVQAGAKLVSGSVFSIVDRFQGVTSIMRLFSNDLMGTGSHYSGWKTYLGAPIFYAGLLPLLLLPQIFVLPDKRKRTIFSLFLLLWLIPVMFPFFRFALYAFMGNYYKHGLSMFIPFIVLLFGLYGFENIQQRNRINYIVLFSSLLVLLTLLHFPFLSGTPLAGKMLIRSDLRLEISFMLFLYSGLLYVLRYEALHRYIKPVLLVLLCFEAGYLSSITVNNRETLTREQFESKVGYNDYTVEAVNYLKSVDSGFYRVNKDYPSPLGEVNSINDAKVHGYFGTPSYSSFNKQEYIDFLKALEVIEPGKEVETRWAIGLLQRPVLQAIASVKYNLVKPADLAAKNSFYQMTYEPIKQFGDVMVTKNKYAMPFGFTYDRYINVAEFEKLSKTQKDIALFLACVTDKDLTDIARIESQQIENSIKNFTLNDFTEIVSQKKTDALDMVYFSQKQFKGNISLDRKKFLFFSIPFDGGWEAFDNGQPIPMMKANIGFMGILLDKGAHNIELRYRVPYIKAAMTVSLISLLIYLAMGSMKIYSSRKNIHSQAPLILTDRNDRLV